MADSTLEYEVRRGLTGKQSVFYHCGKCNAVLSASLKDAGTKVNCPTCGVPHAVPGEAEKQAVEFEKLAKVAEERKAREAAAEARRREIATAKADALALHRREEAKRIAAPKPDDIPTYSALDLCAALFRACGWTCGVIGVLAFFVALMSGDNPEPTGAQWAMGLTYLIGGALVGLFYFGVAALLSAIRDMAINSWHQRRAMEKP